MFFSIAVILCKLPKPTKHEQAVVNKLIHKVMTEKSNKSPILPNYNGSFFHMKNKSKLTEDGENEEEEMDRNGLVECAYANQLEEENKSYLTAKKNSEDNDVINLVFGHQDKAGSKLDYAGMYNNMMGVNKAKYLAEKKAEKDKQIKFLTGEK